MISWSGPVVNADGTTSPKRTTKNDEMMTANQSGATEWRKMGNDSFAVALEMSSVDKSR